MDFCKIADPRLARSKSKGPGARAGSPAWRERLRARPPRRVRRAKAGQGAASPESPAAAGKDRPGSGAPPFRPPDSGIAAFYGIHTVREALRARRRKLLAIYATEQAAAKLGPDIAQAGLRPHIVAARDLALRLGSGAVHQGVLLEALPLPPVHLADIKRKSGIVLALDQITDPHNAGAILRNAAAFDADAVVMTARHAPEAAGALAKAASGALEHVALIVVPNLARALDRLGEEGYLRVGLDSQADESLTEAPLRRPVALVLGAEDKGLRRLTREKCDLLARLDVPGPIKSLNVSNACAAALALLRVKDAIE